MLNKADHFFRTGQAICDDCDAPVERHRVERARGLGPFICQRCADRVMLFTDAGIAALSRVGGDGEEGLGDPLARATCPSSPSAHPSQQAVSAHSGDGQAQEGE